MASPNQPTLLYPNGHERILARVIDIEWKESTPVSNDGLACWYEIYYTEKYLYNTEPDWKMIATVPVGRTKFEWKVGNLYKSKNVRIAIRSVNARGERSSMSVSAADFWIFKDLPNSPAVLSPVPGSRYGNSIQIIFDDSAIRDNAGRRAKYYVYFRSNKAGIPLSSILERVPVGIGPITWDTSTLPPSDDYIVTVYMADDDGNKSSEINITGIEIVNEGRFLIDTNPPDIYMQINGGKEFTKDRNVLVRIFSYDEITNTHAMRFIEGQLTGPAESFSEMKFWTLSESDGEKIIQVECQDYGANRTDVSDKTFRVLFDLNNSQISDIILDTKDGVDSLWVAVNGDAPSIYKIDSSSTFIANVNENINSLSMFGDNLYISVDTHDNTALIYRYDGSIINDAINLTDNESEVSSMMTFKSKLYMGSVGGFLYSYDESIVTTLKVFDYPIQSLFTDGSLLYILLRNRNAIFVFDGNDFSEVKV